MGRLDGKVAIVTGAGNGMGRSEASIFACEGARVAVGEVRERDGRRVEAEIREAGGEAIFIPLDVTSEASWQALVDTVVARFGKLDVLVNNAGISSSSFADTMGVEGWDRILAVNARGPFLGIKYAIPKMLEAGGGSIVNISSTSGLVGSAEGHPAYNASKAAVRLLTKSIAVRYGPQGIRCNSVHPGRMPPMTTSTHTDQERRRQIWNDTVPLRREGRVEEVAYAVLFLASDEASYITGAELVVDGGFTAQ